MGRKVQVCAECTRNCLLFHGREKSSSLLPSSFFKIMLGDDFSRVLYLPPKFSPTVSALVNKKIILRDSNGQQWNVTVSTVDSYFALKEGWNDFSSDHGLEVGDFLVFNYVNELHFDVKIYDKSGCERLDFLRKRNKKKRSRKRSGTPVRDVMLVGQGPNTSDVSEPDVPKMNRQSREVDIERTPDNIENISKYDKSNRRVQSTGITENCEDPCHMSSEDHCGVDGTGKITTKNSKVSHVDYGSRVYQNDATSCDKYPLFEKILGSGAATNASEFELSGKSTDRSACNKTSALKLEENRENNIIMSNGEVQECQCAEGLESDQLVISKKKHDLHIDGFNNIKQTFNGIPNVSEIHNGEMSKKIKKELVDMTSNWSSFKDKLCAEGDMSERIKREQYLVMTPNVPSSKDELEATGLSKVIKGELGQCSHMIDHVDDNQSSAAVSCVVPSENDNFLELPTRLPLCSRRGRGRRGKMDGMLVFLRDPQRNLWPVLYYEKTSFKVLTTGWSQFRRANNIQPSDVCTFGLEDASERIFTVDVVHN